MYLEASSRTWWENRQRRLARRLLKLNPKKHFLGVLDEEDVDLLIFVLALSRAASFTGPAHRRFRPLSPPRNSSGDAWPSSEAVGAAGEHGRGRASRWRSSGCAAPCARRGKLGIPARVWRRGAIGRTRAAAPPAPGADSGAAAAHRLAEAGAPGERNARRSAAGQITLAT